MGETCDNAQQHRLLYSLRVVECRRHHVVSLLLVGWLKDGQQCEFAVEARVLLVLTGMHRRVVGSQYNESALHTRYGTVDKCVGTYVHANVLHAHQGALTGIRHTQGGLHGSLFVGTPS